MNSFQNVDIQTEKGIFWITLNRPDVRNALDAAMLEEIDQALDIAEKSQDTKVIIIQSAGEKSFAAGADIKQLHEKEPLEAIVPGMQSLYSKIEQSTKATIAVVQGYALGGGCELAMACDIRMAGHRAKFGLPELNLGIIPGAGGTQRMARIIGKGRALDMILTGKMIEGKEAERIGLASYYVAEEDSLTEKAQEVATEILKKGPVAIHLAKMAVHKGFDIDESTAMWMEKLSQAVVFGTEDKQEGTKAFIEKRPATFQNK
ncbi:enoyl-CoA hydratase/isomerase family protein [Virgibacillus sp. MSP4-1]|uniref:enoyl-CoA hydratase/isomerase family protein n=1 Tax=Virgibacillus sp. MSP4-1 TaxID=2700081 RepID=UPI0003A6A660|nr:enoyl-CoA hydratase-related protein [Virgibacillus sp. MSP4-1]QHS23366.1 enoyl-CoA hydratase/isomerase family protein [Virgibacillus sp. MSP4-1]